MDVSHSNSAAASQSRGDSRATLEDWAVGGPKRITHFPERITIQADSTLLPEAETTSNSISVTSVPTFVHRRGQLQPGDLEMEFYTDTHPAASLSPGVAQTALPAYAFAYEPPSYNHPTHTHSTALTTTPVVGLPPTYSRGKAVDALQSLSDVSREASQSSGANYLAASLLEMGDGAQDKDEEAEGTPRED